MNKPNIYQHKPLQERQDTPLVLNTSAPAKSDAVRVPRTTKRNVACRSGNTGDSTRPNVGIHTVFVLNIEGKPLTPTTKTKARKLLINNKAIIVWSKFNTFGIQLTNKTREEITDTTLGIDQGSKFDGYSVVCDRENNLSVKLDLPDKKKIVRKIKERREARRSRRTKLRNRNRDNFIAPSQLVLLQSRLKVISEFCNIYPVQHAAIEDVCFNHAKHKWGYHFSTVEIGKNRLRNWFDSRGIARTEFKGYETKKLREKYGYKKVSDKSSDCFGSHCCDSLALAAEVNCGERVEPGEFLVVDDSYRCVRRKIHDSNLKVGGVREKYSRGTVFGLKKGVLLGLKKGKVGQLCGECKGSYIYRDINNKRYVGKDILWISNKLKIRKVIIENNEVSRIS